jgi:hypothetical protein
MSGKKGSFENILAENKGESKSSTSNNRFQKNKKVLELSNLVI